MAMPSKHNFGKDFAVFCMFNNGKTLDAMLNNFKFNQGDEGFDPIRLAQFLQTFLIESGFKATIKELPDTGRGDGKQFPRRSVVVETTKKTQQALLDKINNFNKMFDESDTYTTFETTLACANPKPASALSTSALPFVPGAPVANKTEQVSFASAAAKTKIGPVPITVPTAAAAMQQPPESALQRVARLKREKEALKKEQEALAKALSKAEEILNDENAKSVASIAAFAEGRGEDYLKELLNKLLQKGSSEPKPVEPPARESWGDEGQRIFDAAPNVEQPATAAAAPNVEPPATAAAAPEVELSAPAAAPEVKPPARES